MKKLYLHYYTMKEYSVITRYKLVESTLGEINGMNRGFNGEYNKGLFIVLQSQQNLDDINTDLVDIEEPHYLLLKPYKDTEWETGKEPIPYVKVIKYYYDNYCRVLLTFDINSN